MIRRFLLDELFSLCKQFPAVSLLGARQVGKTTLAKEITRQLKDKSVYFDLEISRDMTKFSDPETFLNRFSDKCVIIDEAQTLPGLFTALRPMIDSNRKPGRFILLGSVSPVLIKNISESLAGRIALVELGTINLKEIQKKKIAMETLWFRGGYPKSLMAENDTQSYHWAENYFRNFIERDVNLLMGETLSANTVKNLWSMIAGINGNLLNIDFLSRSLGITRPTVLKYLDFLEGSFMIQRLQPWFINVKKRITKSPKIYLRDTGILHYLNQIHSYEDLQGHIAVGASWEGFVLEQIRQLKPYWLSLYFYRTHHGAESDIVLVKGIVPKACIEVKLSNAPQLNRGFYEVIDDLKTHNNFVVIPGNEDYILRDNIRVCGIRVFINKYLGEIK